MNRKNQTHHLGVGFIMTIIIIGMALGAKIAVTQAESVLRNTTVITTPVIAGDAVPEATPLSKPTPTAEPPLKPTPTPKPTPRVHALKKVSGVKLIRYSTHTVKITWKKHKKAKYYRVYYSKKKNGKYRLAGITKNRCFYVKKLKNKTRYYFYVQACKKKKTSLSDSAPSDKVRMKMKTYERKIIFAGDSICQGVGYGWSFPEMHSKAKKKTIAYRGLNTITFRTRRIFDGKSGLQKLISEKPYRVYMMLGMNEIPYRTTKQIITDYKDLVQIIREESPNTDIVLCAVSPVTSAELARHPGLGKIPDFNNNLKKLAKKLSIKYFDYTNFLKDSEGYLKAEYAEGDGYHWKPSAYVTFGTVAGKYDKSLDK